MLTSYNVIHPDIIANNLWDGIFQMLKWSREDLKIKLLYIIKFLGTFENYFVDLMHMVNLVLDF